MYKFDCGSGEGQVRIPVDLSDGQWHLVQLERHGREAELSLDSAYTAIGLVPGIHAVLNVDSEEIFFGAEIDVFPNGYRDISHGFEVSSIFQKMSLLVSIPECFNLFMKLGKLVW